MRLRVPTEGIDAVVFDFDGVLARSIELHAVAYQLVLGPFGVPVTPHQVYLWEGARSESIIRSFMEREGLEPNPALVQRLSDIKQATFERIGDPGLYPWAQDVIEAVHNRGFQMAICTGTRRENLPLIAGDLLDRFSYLASQETYNEDKPHPEAFQTAADGLNVPAERCLAVENAPRGIQSAKSAGMTVAAVSVTLPPDNLKEAHIVLDAVPDVLRVLPETPGEPATID